MPTRTALALLALWGGCNGGERPGALTPEQLADPETCRECHAAHVEEWEGSMHAYAAEDPVFRAMNARGQRETEGALGAFCVQCHAPLAVALGLTEDGLNLDEVPRAYHGVTCTFCHQVVAVEGTHNNPLRLAFDDVMRGGFSDAAPGAPHGVAYSPLHDRDDLRSADLCGSCHDIVNPLGTHIERTYTEWKESVYAHAGPSKLTCSECHMRGREGVAAPGVDGVPLRRIHDHSMAGVDVALTDWPGRERQRQLVQTALDTTLLANLCVDASPERTFARVTLENVAAGHMFPSGAASDRRLWVELVAYDEGGGVLWSTGVVDDGEPVASLADPNLWLLRDEHFGADGEPVHMFWEAADVRSTLVPPPVTNDPDDPRYRHFIDRVFTLDGEPARITLRVRLRPIGLDVLDDLVATGDLDPSIRAAVPTFDLGSTVLEWTPSVPRDDGSFACVP